MNPIILWVITIFLFGLGLLGTVLPFIPGTAFVFAGAFLYAYFTDFQKIDATVLIILGAIAVFAYFVDYLAAIFGAKKMGGSKWGVLGALLGGMLGVFGGIFGIVAGAFVGAVFCEMVFAKKDPNQSIKVGLGSALGFLGGALAGIAFSILMVIIFFWSVFF